MENPNQNQEILSWDNNIDQSPQIQEESQVKWGTWEEPIPEPQTQEEPQVQWGNWKEQTPEPQTQEESQVKWGDFNSNKPPTTMTHGHNSNTDDSYQPGKVKTPMDYNPESLNTDPEVSFQKNVNNLLISTTVHKLNYNLEQISKDLREVTKPINNDSKFSIDGQKSSELLNQLFESIQNIAKSRSLELQEIYANILEPKESVINLTKSASKENFIFYVNYDTKGGDVILDFSELNGLSVLSHKPTPGELAIIPGWVNYRITKNLSNTNTILICGSFK